LRTTNRPEKIIYSSKRTLNEILPGGGFWMHLVCDDRIRETLKRNSDGVMSPPPPPTPPPPPESATYYLRTSSEKKCRFGNIRIKKEGNANQASVFVGLDVCFPVTG